MVNRNEAPCLRGIKDRRSVERVSESLLSRPRMHWDHEPTPSPSQEGNGQDADRCLFPSREGNGQDADRCLLPSWEGLGVGRFMESLHSLLRRHWDHEPTPNPSREGNGQDADRFLFPSWEGSGVGRFMERAVQPGLDLKISGLALACAHWDCRTTVSTSSGGALTLCFDPSG